MSKYKAGLHKDVSSIFNGVSLPKNDSAQTPSSIPAAGHQDHNALKSPPPETPAQKPPASETQVQKPSAPEPSVAKSPAAEPPTQKPLTPSNITSTKPKSQQPPKEAPAKQSKATTAAKSARQPQWQKKLEMVKSKLLTPKDGVSATKQKEMVVLIPVLFIALIFVFIRVFSQPQKVAGPKKPATAKV